MEKWFFCFWKGNIKGAKRTKMNDGHHLRLFKYLRETENQTMAFDTRRHERKECLINVDLSSSNSRSNCFILDINHNGAYLETDEPLSINEHIYLNFADPYSGTPMPVVGRVVRIDPHGVGLLFKNLTSDQLRSLQFFNEKEKNIYVIKS